MVVSRLAQVRSLCKAYTILLLTTALWCVYSTGLDAEAAEVAQQMVRALNLILIKAGGGVSTGLCADTISLSVSEILYMNEANFHLFLFLTLFINLLSGTALCALLTVLYNCIQVGGESKPLPPQCAKPASR